MKSETRGAQTIQKEYFAKNRVEIDQKSEPRTEPNNVIKTDSGKSVCRQFDSQLSRTSQFWRPETGNGKLSKERNMGPPGIGPGISTVSG